MSEKNPSPRRVKAVRRRWLAAGAFVFLVVIAAMAFVVARREPILRQRVIDTLAVTFHSQVDLDSFDVSFIKGLQVSGHGLQIFGETDANNHEPGVQPIVSVAEFEFRVGIMELFHDPMHVDTVYLKNMVLNLPPREQRGQMNRFAPKPGRTRIVVDHLVCDHAELVINTLRAGKLPLEFDIASLKMTSIGPDAPLHFDAELTNPKPVGDIHSTGSFGPWQADSPRDTPLSGDYSFNHADLGTIRGIAGILSSTGNYAGVLDQIVVDGSTDTPDFRIASGGRAVPLHTDFHAIVDGTSGNTYLQPVKARIADSWLTAEGSIVRTQKPYGHHVKLDVRMTKAQIADLLKLAVATNPPVMKGFVKMTTRFDLPPGELDVANRLKLSGTFQLSNASFSNPQVQQKVDALSMRSQGKPKLAMNNIPDNVRSDLDGKFNLDAGVLTFPRLQFLVPGARVSLTGTYSLDGNEFDFHGNARMSAKLSHMVTGWKSVLLKPADPFFSKNGAGTEIPVKVTGTKSEPHFGSDFGRKDKEKYRAKEKDKDKNEELSENTTTKRSERK
jgi:hypothetical protein